MMKILRGLSLPLALALGLLTAQSASALQRHDLPVVKNLAYRVEDGARRIKIYAERFGGNHDPMVRRVIYKLYQCEMSSARFRQTVDYWWRDRMSVERNYRELQFCVADVDRIIFSIRPLAPTLNEWRQTVMEMRQIDRLMGRSAGPGHGPGHSYVGPRDQLRSSQFDRLYSR